MNNQGPPRSDAPPSGPRVLGRYEPTATLPSVGDLQREAGRDSVTGALVEIVRAAPHAALREGSQARFASAWTERVGRHPAWLEPLAGPAPGGASVAVRPAISTPWTEGIRLSADDARRIAGWVGGALLADTQGLGGELGQEDLVFDGDGIPRLSPSGLVRVASVARLPHHRPPTVHQGPGGDRDAALYGLGALLFHAVTGVWPTEARSPDGLRTAQATPRRARALLPDLPADVDALLAALLDPDPARRAPAIAAVIQASPPVVRPTVATPEVAVPAASQGAPAALRVSRQAPQTSAARVDTALAPWVVVFDRTRATAASLRRLEALLPELPHFALRDGPSAAGGVVVASAKTEAEAQDLARTLGRSGAPLDVRSTAAPAVAQAGAAVGWMVAAVLAPLLGLLAGGPVVGGIGAVAGLVLALVAGRTLRQNRAEVRSLSASTLTDPAQLPRLPDGPRHVLDAVQQARRTLMGGDLSDALRVDLLQSLEDIEAAALAGQGASQDELDELRAAALEVADAVSGAAGEGAPERSRATVDHARRRAAAARAALRQP